MRWRRPLGHDCACGFAGYVDHYQTGADDMGWGCGWRNIMMICSNLVRREVRSPSAWPCACHAVACEPLAAELMRPGVNLLRGCSA